MTAKRLSLVAALVLASCTTKNQSSYIVIASVLGGTPSTPATVPPTCTPGTVETDFLLVNAAETQGHASVRVLNTLAQNGNPGTNRLNSNDFIVHQAVISYEVIGQAPLPQQIVPADGVVPAGGSKSVGVFFFPPGAKPPATAGQTIRVTFHIEGHLIDGSSARTNEYEYLFVTCAAPGCAGSCG